MSKFNKKCSLYRVHFHKHEIKGELKENYLYCKTSCLWVVFNVKHQKLPINSSLWFVQERRKAVDDA